MQDMSTQLYVKGVGSRNQSEVNWLALAANHQVLLINKERNLSLLNLYFGKSKIHYDKECAVPSQ